MTKPVIDIRRTNERFATRTSWLDSHHSFSFGHHYNPENTHHGLLLVSNDDIIQPQTGFSTHPHQDMEIITWVLEGELEHKDTLANRGIIYPGLAQRMSAGTGIWHSEMNASDAGPVRLVQMWVVPDTERIDPSYEQLDVSAQLQNGGLIPIASGRSEHTAITIRQKDATLWVGRLQPGETVKLPDARFLHVYIAKGTARIDEAGEFGEGDAVRLTAAGARNLASGPEGAEVLIWEMNDGM